MTDEQINKELAEAMDGFEYRPIYDQEYAGEREYTGSIFVSNDMRIFEFSYKDPAIFAENVKFILFVLRGEIKTPDHYSYTKPNIKGYVYKEGVFIKEINIPVIDYEIEKAAALARIEASKDNEQD